MCTIQRDTLVRCRASSDKSLKPQILYRKKVHAVFPTLFKLTL